MKIKLTNVLLDKRKKIIINLMRTFIFLFCTAIFAITPGDIFSQNAKIIIESDRIVSVDEVFDLIQKQTNYNFIYQVDLFINEPKVHLKKGIINANELLKVSLSKGNFNFSFTNKNTIVIKVNPAVIAQQQITITGKVTDKANVPVVGVSIMIKGTKRIVLSDFEGNYSIIASRGDKLVFTYIGFMSETVVISEQAKVNIVLQEDVTVLSEIVVSTGYQKIAVERATGSFEKINTKILDTKINQDIISKIEGEVAGVNFENGSPIIRGISTFRSDVRPLIVVDGFAVTQDFSTINPNDIETIDVLKDAAAASIWGIRAANGVIVLTTKKGLKNSKPKIAYSNNLSITPIQKSRDLPYANTQSFLEFEKYRVNNGWVSQVTTFNLPPYTQGTMTFLDLKANKISQLAADAITNKLKGIDSRNEFDDLFRSDPIWIQHNLSISGGGELSTYRTAITYNMNNNQGSYVGNKRNELIANLNHSINLSKKLSLTTSLNYVTNSSKANGLSDSHRESLPQYQQILDPQGNYINQIKTFPQNFKENLVAKGYPYNWDYNLKQEQINKNNVTEKTNLRLQAELKYKITKNLSASGSFQYEWDNLNQTVLYNEESYRVRDMVNIFTIVKNKVLVNQIPKGDIIETSNAQNKSDQIRGTLDYDKSFNNSKHRITSLAGVELRKDEMERTSFTRYGYDPRSLTAKDVAYGTRFGVIPTGTRLLSDPSKFEGDQNRFFSYFANFVYTYQNKYSLSGSTRLDDTNLFGASKKYKNIPLYSMGFKWDITKENFIKQNKTLSKLALRATYGSNGAVDRSTSPFLLAQLKNDVSTGLNYAYVSNVKNPLLRLEKTFVTNIGVDYGFFNNKIYGSIEFYDRKSKDLLSTVTVPTTLGFTNALLNVGEMTNRGVDLSINASIINAPKFKYSTTFNFSFNKNEVTKVEVPDQTSFSYLIGVPIQNKPLNHLYSYNYNGLDQNGNPTALNEKGEVVDVNGNVLNENNKLIYSPIQSIDALVYNGTTSPKYYGGWINTFNFGNYFLRGLITYKLGHVFRNSDFLDYRYFNTNPSGVAYIHKDYENRWQNPGDELSKTVPRIPINSSGSSLDGYSYYASGNQFIDSASHIRFTEVVIGYNFSNTVLDRIGFNQFGISLQVRDLGIITFNKWNKDPESILMPRKPTFTLNFNLNF
jgi:TonB-linked SusC/RagA family outer membrane protein